MKITLFSFITSMIWSSIIVMLMYFLRKKYSLVRSFGIISILFVYLFCILRMIIPLEFTMTKEVFLFNDFYEFIYIDKILGTNLSVFSIFVIIWIAGTIFLSIRIITIYLNATKDISRWEVLSGERYDRIVEDVLSNLKTKQKVTLRYNALFQIPVAMGVFKKTIILPYKGYSDSELYNILLHEYTHLMNHDTLIAIMIKFFSYIFWWNPIAYLLQKDFRQSMEIRCDLSVTKDMDFDQTAKYLKTIQEEVKRVTSNNDVPYLGANMLFIFEKEYPDVERFRVVRKRFFEKQKYQSNSLLVWIMMIAIWILSYTFVIQPYYKADNDNLKIDNDYILQNNDGTYSLLKPNGEFYSIDEEMATTLNEQGVKIVTEDD